MIYDTTIAGKLQVYFLHKYTEGMFFQSILFFLKKEEEGGGDIFFHGNGNAIDAIPDFEGQFLFAMAIRIDAAGEGGNAAASISTWPFSSGAPQPMLIMGLPFLYLMPFLMIYMISISPF